ncbi:MAG: cupin domain-containing protein [Planctomycetota bacterium]|nr:cupin domain-containing protein [Planctomycetota bacterium]
MEETLVARRIKAQRLDRAMTLRDVAKATGLTEGLLSKIENHRVSPPIATLSKIAAALGVKIGWFFREDEAYVGYTVKRAAEATRGMTRSRRTGYDYSLLAAGKPVRKLEPFLVRLAPGLKQKKHLHHSGDEFVYVLRGELSFQWGRETFLLKAGDSITYDAAVPHLSRNPNRKRETLFLAVTAEESAGHRLGFDALL